MHSLLILELHNIWPYKKKYSQPLKSFLSITKYILETIVHLMYVGRHYRFILSNGTITSIENVSYDPKLAKNLLSINQLT
jgi:hypothetical protein